jgi:RNA polymerase sigma-70 factor (ECF subfamily)
MQTERFEDVILPHLDAAYNLARWLMRSDHDAEDMVQEAFLRALRYFGTFRGGNGRAWLLRIVRNTCIGSLQRLRAQPVHAALDEQTDGGLDEGPGPEELLMRADDGRLIEQALRALPERFRELLVLRELEGLSYRELAGVVDVPIGTVMSTLSRARQAFRRALLDETTGRGDWSRGREDQPRDGRTTITAGR